MISRQVRAIVAIARWFTVCSILGAPTVARGQVPLAPSSSESPVQPQAEPTVVIMFDPRESDSLTLVGSIAAHLAGLPVRLINEPRTRTEILTWLEAGRSRVKAARALGLFAVDTSRRDSWRLFFLEPEGIPTLIRRLKPTPEYAPLDEAGITVRLLVEALLDGKHVDVVEPVLREEPPEAGESPPAPAPVPPPAKQQGPSSSGTHGTASPPESSDSEADEPLLPAREEHERVYASALLGLSTTKWLSAAGWQSGLLIGGGLYWAPPWSVTIDYTWYPKLSYRSPDATIELLRHPFAGHVNYRLSPDFSPVFALGAWLDAISRETAEPALGYRGTGSTTDVVWGLSASVGISSPRLSILRARLDLGLDLAGRRVGYGVRSETTQTVLTTSLFQPLLGVILELE
jgi:hypothetical protein